jgi:hypothetical protein
MTPFLSMPLLTRLRPEPKPASRRVPLLRVERVEWPYPALELVHRDGRGWLICPLTTDLTTRPLVERDSSVHDRQRAEETERLIAEVTDLAARITAGRSK